MKVLSLTVFAVVTVVTFTLTDANKSSKLAKKDKKDKKDKSDKSSKAPTAGPTTTPSAGPTASPSTATPTEGPTPLKGFYPFISGALDIHLDMQAIHATVKELGGNLEGSFMESKEPYLTMEQCNTIREYTDQRWKVDVASGIDMAQGKNFTLDYRIEIEPHELAQMIGTESLRRLHEAFLDYDDDYPVSRIVVRRTTSAHDHHIQYHRDGATSVMHLWLNGPEEEIDGGGLWYLTPNGTTTVDTTITGAATFHSENVVHGVAAFAGTRFILIFLGDHVHARDVIAPFLEAVVVDSGVHSEL